MADAGFGRVLGRPVENDGGAGDGPPLFVRVSGA